MTDADRKRLEEIKTRCEAATEGPWVLFDNGFKSGVAAKDDDFPSICGGPLYEGYMSIGHPDTIFISHARADIPWLLAKLEELT